MVEIIKMTGISICIDQNMNYYFQNYFTRKCPIIRETKSKIELNNTGTALSTYQKLNPPKLSKNLLDTHLLMLPNEKKFIEKPLLSFYIEIYSKDKYYTEEEIIDQIKNKPLRVIAEFTEQISQKGKIQMSLKIITSTIKL